MEKLECMDLPMFSKYIEEKYTKGTKTIQPKQLSQMESIDSPSTARSSKRSRKKLVTITFKNVE